MNLSLLSPEAAMLHQVSLATVCEKPIPASVTPNPIDWESLIALVKKHKVLPTVSRTLLPLLPPEIKGSFVAERDRLAARVEALLEESVKFQRRAAEREINLVFIKGAPFGQLHYGDPFLRQTMDVDMLVEKDAVLQMDAILRELGYTVPVDRYVYPAAVAPSSYSCPLPVNYTDTGNVYHMLRPDYVRYEGDIKLSAEIKYFIRYVENRNIYRLFTTAIDCEMDGRRLRSLSRELSVIQFCLDKYKDFIRGAQFSYRDICDVVRLVDRYREDAFWGSTLKAADELGVTVQTLAVLAVAESVAGLAPHSGLLRKALAAQASATKLFGYLSLEGVFSPETNRQRYNAQFADAYIRHCGGSSEPRPPGSAGVRTIIGQRVPFENTLEVPCSYVFNREGDALQLRLRMTKACWRMFGHGLLFLTLFGNEKAAPSQVVAEYTDDTACFAHGYPAPADTGVQAVDAGDDREIVITLRGGQLGASPVRLYSLRFDRRWYKVSDDRRMFSLVAAHDRRILNLAGG